MKLTRKQAENIIEDRYRDWDGGYVDDLCFSNSLKIRPAWDKYWRKINTRGYSNIAWYFPRGACYEEYAFLRLLTLHIFVRDTYK